MKLFLAVCILATAALARPTKYGGSRYGRSYNGRSYNEGSNNGVSTYSAPQPIYGGQMQPSSSPQMRIVPNPGYSAPITYTAPGQIYMARPVTYVVPQFTFNPPEVKYRGQALTYSEADAQMIPLVFNYQGYATNEGSAYN